MFPKSRTLEPSFSMVLNIRGLRKIACYCCAEFMIEDFCHPLWKFKPNPPARGRLEFMHKTTNILRLYSKKSNTDNATP